MTRRRWVLLGAVGAFALIGVSALPGLGASAPPGGAALTRVYDPAAATTTFTVDVARGSGATLSLVTCPGAGHNLPRLASASVLDAIRRRTAELPAP